jgi:histidinol-phosphate phosphatase family protein
LSTPFVVLDRDGTLIKHVHYLTNPYEVELLPDVISGLIIFQKLGFSFGMITNQSVIGRGIGTKDQVISVNERVFKLIQDGGIVLKFTLFCPHIPEDQCNCRKPAPGLGIEAIKSYNIDPSRSYMIGDQVSDIKFGNAIGFRSIQISDFPNKSSGAALVTNNLLSAANWVSFQLGENK